jgi:hypothetical protein
MARGIKILTLAMLLGAVTAGYCLSPKEITTAEAKRIASQFTKQAGWANGIAPEKFVEVKPIDKWHDLRPALQLESDRQNPDRWIVTIDRENGEVLGALLFSKAIDDARPRFLTAEPVKRVISDEQAWKRGESWLRSHVKDFQPDKMRRVPEKIHRQTEYALVWRGWYAPNKVWTRDRIYVWIDYSTGKQFQFGRDRDPFPPPPAPKITEAQAIERANSYLAGQEKDRDRYELDTPTVTDDFALPGGLTISYMNPAPARPPYARIVHYRTKRDGPDPGHVMEIYIDAQSGEVLGISRCK